MYSLETYKADKLANDAAKAELSKLVAGEGTGKTVLYQGEYARIATYFGQKDNNEVTHYGNAVRRVARMYMVISTADRINGFDCNIYSTLLNEIDKKIKSMRVFKRKNKIKCFAPNVHRQPCYCARLEAVQAANSIASSGVEASMKEELIAKVNGALILEKEFEGAI